MLTKNDKKWIVETFRKEIRDALTVDIMMKRKRDPETGQPIKVPIKKLEKVFLPDHWVTFLPFYEQAILLSEKASEQSRNKSHKAIKSIKRLQSKVDSIGNLYRALEGPLKILAAFSDHMQGKQITMSDQVRLIYNKDKKDDAAGNSK